MPAPSRSSVFAFRSQGIHPVRKELNDALGNNAVVVTQLFSTRGDDQQILTCFRLSKAVPRIRIITVLRRYEWNSGVNFKPIPGSTWADSVFMGDEVRNGEGTAIVDALRQHMQDRTDSFHESIADNVHHCTHMLRDPIQAPRPVVVNVQPEPVMARVEFDRRISDLREQFQALTDTVEELINAERGTN